MSDMIGRKLGQYEITGLIGEGGMARVYRAHQPNVRRDVAIKVIESRLVGNPEFIKRFEREAQTIAALNHPFILKLFDFGETEGMLYLVMELQQGGSLAKLIHDQGQLSGDQTARYLTQIGDALDYAHEHGVIHRDMKPQNVLLDEKGNAILTDFGIARLMTGTNTVLTGTGMAMGTPGYMAPEQWYGHQLDGRTDLYALGVMAFEMLTGKMPFSADTPASLMYQHLNQPPASLGRLRADLPASVENVLIKSMAKQPDQRFHSGLAFAEAFRASLSGKTPVGISVASAMQPLRPLTTGPVDAAVPGAQTNAPSRSRAPMALAAGVVLLLSVIVGVLLIGRGSGVATETPPAETIVASASQTALAALAATGTPIPPTSTPSETAMPPSATFAPTHTFTATMPPSATPSHTATATPTVTETQIPPSATATPTFTLTLTTTATFTPSETPNLETLVVVLAISETAIVQETIDSYTDTPSPTFTETPDLPGTARAVLNLTQTAIAVASFTRTPTPTATLTLTRTPIPTDTPTPTHTPTPTLTYTPRPTRTPTRIPAGTSNSAWTPVERDFNGVMMVYVPAGCFMMGNDVGFANEKPAREVCFSKPFWLDKYEVGNGQFARFGGTAASKSNWTDDPYPREQITWNEASAFCQLRGGRLPTEAEWEYAAAGPQDFAYPWGSVFNGDKIVYSVNAGGKTAPVGSNPAGASWVGALDMAGNVWEWVYDWYKDPYDPSYLDPQGPASGTHRVVRGGSWEYDANQPSSLRVSYRGWWQPTGQNARTGFRCARDEGASVSAAPLSAPTPTQISLAAPVTPIPAGTSNKAWTPVERDFDGVTMVYVPAGCFVMGNDDGGASERPAHPVCVEKPFWLDRLEVSNAQFKQFGGKAASFNEYTGDTYPRETVSFAEALAFCNTRGARLPTEAEWEYAARGPEGWLYAWGNVFDKTYSVSAPFSGYDLAPVGSKPAGASWVGALDMTGNLWEWTASVFKAYPYNPEDGRENYDLFLKSYNGKGGFAVRGGSAQDSGGSLFTTYRRGYGPWDAYNVVGFRCARDE